MEDKLNILDGATKTIRSLIEKIQTLQKENDELKKEIKRLQWSLYEQD
jgi:peptidoglycan hydrolase CwlO-like protein